MKLDSSASRFKKYRSEVYLNNIQKGIHEEEKAKRNEKKREYWDNKTQTLAKTVMVEVRKRNIDLNDTSSMNKIESIIEECMQLGVFKNRFEIRDYAEILNAVKRYLNKNIIKEGPSLDE